MIGWILFALLMGLIIGFWLGACAIVWLNISKHGWGWEKRIQVKGIDLDSDWGFSRASKRSGRKLP